MDEMKMKLRSKFMRKFASSLITKFIFKKYGYKLNIQLNDLDISFVDGDTKIITNVELKMDSQEFKKVVNDIGII